MKGKEVDKLISALHFYAEHFPYPNGLVDAWTEYGSIQRKGYYCCGCSSEGIATWPNWEEIKITHRSDCAYIASKKILEETTQTSNNPIRGEK